MFKPSRMYSFSQIKMDRVNLGPMVNTSRNRTYCLLEHLTDVVTRHVGKSVHIMRTTRLSSSTPLNSLHQCTIRETCTSLINFRFQLMHYNFISLIILLYMFRALMCPSSGGSTIHSQQLVQCHLFLRPYRR